jgi:predicted porin
LVKYDLTSAREFTARVGSQSQAVHLKIFLGEFLMKKSLLALAVLGAFAGAAQAQSNVTLYGVIDVGFVRESGGPAGSVNKITSGVESGSRIGVRGVEDLGGGLKAKFVAESGFCADSTAGGGFCTGGGTFMGRQAYVGLEGGWGSLTLGRQYNPWFLQLTTVDPFGTGLAGQIGNTAYSAGVRTNNAVIYATPDFSGFGASVLWAPGEVAGNSAAGRTYGLGVKYSNGPLWVSFAHHNVNSVAASPVRTRASGIAGTYDFGVAKVHAYYAATKNNTAPVSFDQRDTMLGVSAPVGPGTLLASYVRRKNKVFANADADQWGVGYDYNLSKRTNAYLAYGSISNDAAMTAANIAAGLAATVGNATEAGSGDRAFNIGIRHKF